MRAAAVALISSLAPLTTARTDKWVGILPGKGAQGIETTLTGVKGAYSMPWVYVTKFGMQTDNANGNGTVVNGTVSSLIPSAGATWRPGHLTFNWRGGGYFGLTQADEFKHVPSEPYVAFYCDDE